LQAKQEINDNPLNNIDQLSNKDLLLNLLQASNNFQNRDFLNRLKNIVTGSDNVPSDHDQDNDSESVSFGNDESISGLTRVKTDTWAPATKLPGSSTSTKLENIVNSLPIWPAKNNLISPGDSFEPSNTFRYPNRRIDDVDHYDNSDQNKNLGVGEISLVSDNERKKITSVGGFKSSPSDYKLSDRLDFTSDNEFVVGASLAMNQASPKSPKNDFSQNFGVGFATPLPSSGHSSEHGLTQVHSIGDGLSSGSDFVSQRGSNVDRGSEVFRLGSGVQLQNPNIGHSPLGFTNTQDNQNYILPTYSNNNKYGEASNFRAGDNGEIYADIRLESGKKNLLTAPSDPHSLYIDTSQNQLNTPEAEVILYPMGQLLSNSRQMVAAASPDSHVVGDVMLMSGSDIGSAMTEQRRDQIPAYQIPVTDTDIVQFGVKRKSPPQGLLETIIRTAKDDLDFAGNVLSYITSRSS